MHRVSWATRRLRDLTIVRTPDGSDLVIACDSVGGIGPKPGDSHVADARTVAHFGARVPLLEILASGADPLVIVDTLSFERGPVALEMIDELRALAREVGLDPDVAVTGSTEDNVATTATGIGITVIGVASAGMLRLGSVSDGDEVHAVGTPMSAPSVRLQPGDTRMPSLAEVVALGRLPGVHEVLPVGSRGIAFELGQLVSGTGLTVVPVPGSVDVHASAGPSTCVLFAVAPSAARSLTSVRGDLPVELVGRVQQARPNLEGPP